MRAGLLVLQAGTLNRGSIAISRLVALRIKSSQLDSIRASWDGARRKIDRKAIRRAGQGSRERDPGSPPRAVAFLVAIFPDIFEVSAWTLRIPDLVSGAGDRAPAVTGIGFR